MSYRIMESIIARAGGRCEWCADAAPLRVHTLGDGEIRLLCDPCYRQATSPSRGQGFRLIGEYIPAVLESITNGKEGDRDE